VSFVFGIFVVLVFYYDEYIFTFLKFQINNIHDAGKL